MTMRELEYADALSEFVSGFTGDCGECAELCALHAVNPALYPLDAAHLSAITHRDVSHGWASSNGAEPLSSIAADLSSLHISYHSDGFSQPAQFNWRADLSVYGGVQPLIFEVALAENLPGDESGVHYHFITCLGWDNEAAVGVFADGDNLIVREGRSGPVGVVRYTLAELEAATICGLIIFTVSPDPAEVPPPAPAPTGMRAYAIVSGDTLSGIAAKLHLSSWYHNLYQPNMAAIEAAARAHGQPDSNGGNLIYPGTVLHYQA